MTIPVSNKPKSSAQVISQAPPWVPRASVRDDVPELSDKSWAEYLNSLCDEIDREDESANRLRYEKYIYLRRFVEGYELGRFDEWGRWVQGRKEQGDPIYVSNLVRYFVRSLVADDVSSQVVYDVMPVSDQIEHEAAARLAGNILAYVRRNGWTLQDQQRESKFTVINGSSFRLTRPRRQERVTVPRPRIEERTVMVGGGTAHCTECLAMGEQESFASGTCCPECGSSAVTVAKRLEVQVPEIVGFDQEQAVEVTTQVVDPMAVKLPLSARSLRNAWYVRWSVSGYTRQFRARYPWAKIGDTSRDETHLQYQREMERSPGNIGRMRPLFGDNDANTCEQRSYWLKPWAYADYVIPQDELLADGTMLKAGTKMIEKFPDGLALSRIGSTIIAIWPEIAEDVWSHRQWDLNPDSIWPSGIEDVITSAKQYNEIASLRYEILLANASPRRYFNPNKFRRQDFNTRPDWAVPMRTNGATALDNPANYIYTEQPRNGDPTIPAFLEDAKRDMQLLAGGVIAPQSGMPDTNNPTARGKIIMRDAAQKMLRPLLLLKAQCDMEVARQVLRHVRYADLAPYYAERTEGEYADFELEAWEQLNPDVDLHISARAGSEMPISEDDKVNNLVQAMTIAGIPGGIFNEQIVPDELRDMMLAGMNLPIKADRVAPDERKQRIEIHKMQEFAKQAEAQGLTPDVVSAMAAMSGSEQGKGPLVPVSIYGDDHEVHIGHIIKFLKTDAGQKASPILQRLLMDHVAQHEQGAVMLAQRQQMLGVAVAAPAMQAQVQASNAINSEQQAGSQERKLPMRVGPSGEFEK